MDETGNSPIGEGDDFKVEGDQPELPPLEDSQKEKVHDVEKEKNTLHIIYRQNPIFDELSSVAEQQAQVAGMLVIKHVFPAGTLEEDIAEWSLRNGIVTTRTDYESRYEDRERNESIEQFEERIRNAGRDPDTLFSKELWVSWGINNLFADETLQRALDTHVRKIIEEENEQKNYFRFMYPYLEKGITQDRIKVRRASFDSVIDQARPHYSGLKTDGFEALEEEVNKNEKYYHPRDPEFAAFFKTLAEKLEVPTTVQVVQSLIGDHFGGLLEENPDRDMEGEGDFGRSPYEVHRDGLVAARIVQLITLGLEAAGHPSIPVSVIGGKYDDLNLGKLLNDADQGGGWLVFDRHLRGSGSTHNLSPKPGKARPIVLPAYETVFKGPPEIRALFMTEEDLAKMKEEVSQAIAEEISKFKK